MSASFLRHSVCAIAWVAFLLLPAHAGTFKNPELIDTSYDPQGIASGDFNGDGIPDIAYVNGFGPTTLHILLGKGDGTFTHGQDIALPQAAGTNSVINLGDVTNDGITDIVIGGGTSSHGTIMVLAGNGDGTFRSPVVSNIAHTGFNGGTPYLNAVMGIGDMNGDGAADLVVADPASATLYVLFGDNKGDFTIGNTVTFYFTGESNTYLFDLNGDGHLDAIVNNLLGAQTVVWLGNGDGTFQAGVSYTSWAVAVADMDGDGHPDLVGEIYPGQVQVLKGNPDGTFASPAIVTTVPAGDFLLAAGDFNGDGIADMLFTTPSGVGIVLGKGNLNYGSIVPSVAGTTLTSYLLGFTENDFNRDGHLDVAMAVNGGVLILKGNGNGSFASGDSYDVGSAVGTVAVADFNGDKSPDIAVSVSATYPRVLLGNGAGQFTLAPDQNQSYGSQSPSGSVTAADFNGDKKNDLYMLEDTQGYPYGQPFILVGLGNGKFTSPTSIDSGPTLIGDLNGDGRSDMVTLSNGSIVAMLGQTNGTFQQVLTTLTEPSGMAALGDVNHDGKLDLLTFEYPAIRVWLGNGNGSFTQSSLLSAPPEPLNFQSVAVADLDGDGNADIVVVLYPNQIGAPYPLLIYYGNGDGTFQDGVLLPISHSYTQLVLADINGDNKPDFILSDGNGIAVIPNLGGRNFGAEEHYVAGSNISGLTVADVNGDGFPDIIAANAGGTTVAVLLNQPNGNPIDGAPSNGVFTIAPEPAQYGQPVTLSITMSAPSGPAPTGSVSFNVDGSFIATTKLVSGQAAHSFSGVLNTGTHTFVATYNGDQTYAPESFAVLHTVTPPIYATSTVLVASPTTVYTSQTVSLSATVSTSVQVPNGVFTFFDGTKALGARTMESYGSQTVILDTNLLDAGTHTLTAVYNGWQDPFNQQAVYRPSTSTPVTVVVNATPTTTSLAASSQQVTAGTVVTFNSNATSNSGTPFGGVTFFDGTAPLGTGSLKADGSCAFSTASLAVGNHNITAAYNANATFAGSTSAVVVVTVTSAVPGLSPTVTALAITASGEQEELTASVRSVSGVQSGDLIFLDNGTILGTARADDSGTAVLPISPLAGGTHNLFASFNGDSQYAPSASPALLEQFPAGNPGFNVSVSGNSLFLEHGVSNSIALTIVPVSGFRQQVKLACVNGVPPGYECSFSPSSLYSGSSYLTIRPLSHPPKAPGRSRGFFLSGVVILSFTLVGAANRRRIRYLPVLLVIAMTACGNPYTSAEPKIMVLSVQATAGSCMSEVIHSQQIGLIVRD